MEAGKDVWRAGVEEQTGPVFAPYTRLLYGRGTGLNVALSDEEETTHSTASMLALAAKA